VARPAGQAARPVPATAANSGNGQVAEQRTPPGPGLVTKRGRARLRDWRLRDWRLRSRLLLLISIPTLAAVLLGGLRVASSVHSAAAFQRAEERAVLASDITQLAQRLATERDETIYYIALGNSGRAAELAHPTGLAPTSNPAQQYRALQAFYQQTDQSVGQFRARLAQFRGAYPAGSRQELGPALSALGTLRYLRQKATKSQMPELIAFSDYTKVLDSLFQVEDQTALGSGDPQLSQTVELLGLVSRIKEEASEQRAILSAALLQGALSPQEATALNRAAANQQGSQQTFDMLAATPQRQLWNNAVSGSFVYLAASDEQQAASLQAHAHSLAGDSLNADSFYDAMTNGIDNQMGSVERTLARQVIDRANALRSSAVTSAVIAGLVVLAFLTLALVFTIMVARSMVVPLRRLRAGAIEVAGVGLPRTVRRINAGDTADMSSEVDPINVDSTDEIGEVARAFDQVHREAVRLASTEAALRGNVNAMFVNLSRRSQSLVERQIHLIDDLEQGEQDSERLGNLFQLDHLATRMRRNSENLLVLAGHEVGRAWKQSVPLVDVLRAAVSEIEHYERVALRVQPGIAVRGPAVSDVVHLVSELVENATSYSAADTPVSVSGQQLSSGGVLLDITDRGVGMGADDMAEANRRLDEPPAVDVSVSRRMGLFVVARLAARHGIRVRLRAAPTGGLTALVWLPDQVVSLDTGARRQSAGGFPRPARPSAGADSPGIPGRQARTNGSGLPVRTPQESGRSPLASGRPQDPAPERS
jgi:signal transduction histidine kinase